MRPNRCGGVRYAASALPCMDHWGAAAHEKGPGNVYFFMVAVFFGAMGMFAGAAALLLTSTPVNRLLLGHQAAEIVLFCLLAIALSAVIATLG